MSGNDTEREALARFQALLDAYGAEPRRWPADQRVAAEALLKRSSEAQVAHAAAARLDKLLDSAGVDPAPAHLIGRVLDAAPVPPGQRWRWFARLLKPATGIAFAAVLGLGLGGLVSPFASGEPSDAESITLAIGDIPEVEL